MLNGDVFIPFFLWPLTDGQGQGVSLGDEQRHFSLTFRQRGKVPRYRPLRTLLAADSILLVIIITKATKGKVEVKGRDPRWGQAWLFPVAH